MWAIILAMGLNIPEENKRMLIGCRISPKSHKFLSTVRADNLGRAIDQLVEMQLSIITAMKNRMPASQRVQIRKPAQLDMERE